SDAPERCDTFAPSLGGKGPLGTMPSPSAMRGWVWRSMMLTRRDFVRNGSAVVTMGAAVPAIFRRAATVGLLDRAEAAGTPGKTLVILQLAGGNDGLNTVVPFADGAYHTVRRTLGVAD